MGKWQGDRPDWLIHNLYMRLVHILSSLISFPALEARAMTKKLILVGAAGVLWIGLPALGAHILFGQSPVAHQIRPTKAEPHFATAGEGSIGSAREAAVIAATRRYVATHPDAPMAMREGRELAPVEALNADLAEQKAGFRVRAVKGMRAQFYEVS
jgi:hypothetical protein